MDRVFALFPRLAERKTQKAGTMSGGEQQMCAIGRALMARPKLLMLDEPSMGLAPIFVERIFETIVEINKQGTPILLVEQNALMALDVAHRGYVLETGKIALADDAKVAAAERAGAQDLPRRDLVDPALIVSDPSQRKGASCKSLSLSAAAAAARHRDDGRRGRRIGEDHAAGEHRQGGEDRLVLGHRVPAARSSTQGSKPVGSDIDIAHRHRAAHGREGGVQERRLRLDHRRAAHEEVRRDHQRHERHGRAPQGQVDFVDYLKVGQSLMVKKGNPKHISTLASLSGQAVSVQSGRRTRHFLAAESAKLEKQGKKAITIKTFPKDTDAISALKAGRVDAYFADSPVVALLRQQGLVAADRRLADQSAPVSVSRSASTIRFAAAVQKAVNRCTPAGR